jgi:ATP-dependent DNA ligase
MQPIPYFGEKIQGDWIYEPKIDGWRMQIIHYRNNHLECWGRRLERKPNWSGKLGYMLDELKNLLPAETLFDCELYSSEGRRFVPSLFAKKPKAKPLVYIFDVIFFEGQNVSKKPLRKRKAMLRRIRFKSPFLYIPGKPLTSIKSDYMSEVRKGREGIVIKKLNSPYLIGKESPIATQYWRKIK